MYVFTTDHIVAFKVLLARNRTWFPDNPELSHVYTFDIYTDPPSTIRDEKIKATIADIISKRMLDEPEMVITYHCDNDDGRGVFRSRKFNGWHQLMDQEVIHKYDREVICDEDSLHSSILIHRENSRYSRIVNLYRSGDGDVTEKFFSE
ncbi:DUF6169 family protein [Dyadobacter fermentans]|uniref:DUF6169 family protein n=1 Tax=Dyadobacter fermentans TaxID=94254 RepID=UPI001CBBCF8A